MNIDPLIHDIVALLTPFLPYLLKEDEHVSEELRKRLSDHVWKTAKAIWDKIRQKIETGSAMQNAIQDADMFSYEEDALAALRLQLKKLLAHDAALTSELGSLWAEVSELGEVICSVKEVTPDRWLDVLDNNDDGLKRLEMIRLLRTGIPSEEIAKQFNADVEYLYKLNALFSLNGASGILSYPEAKNWFDNLSKDDPIIRRLEMIRLLRSGTPLHVITKQYDAIPEYISRLNERFSRHGVIGILTEDDLYRFRSIYPEVIRICTYNLHGTHRDSWFRFRRIAHELTVFDPDLGAFQEVISTNGIEETSAQIARWMSRITGYYYRTRYFFCHFFLNEYPEGIAVLSRHQFRNIQVMDLNRGLGDGLVPRLDRYAAVAEVEIYKHKIIFVSLHLDHENPRVRLAQAEKLLRELDHLFGRKRGYCYILAGDFNDTDDSPVMTFLRKSGYKDTYRSCHMVGGNTFDAVNPHKRIDYIMVKGDVNFLSAELVPRDSELSDHIGVFATIEIKRMN